MTGRYTREGDVRALLAPRPTISSSSRAPATRSRSPSTPPPCRRLPPGMAAHVPALRRRLQQGDGPQLRQPGHRRAAAVSWDDAVSVSGGGALSAHGGARGVSEHIQHARDRAGAGIRLWALGFRLSGFRLQASGFRLQASGFRLQASGFECCRQHYSLSSARIRPISVLTTAVLRLAMRSASTAVRNPSRWARDSR